VNVSVLLEMAASAMPSRIAIGSMSRGLTYSDLAETAEAGAVSIRSRGVDRVVFIGANSDIFPIVFFASSRARRPLVPLSYRMGRAQLTRLIDAQPRRLIVADYEGAGWIDGALSPQQLLVETRLRLSGRKDAGHVWDETLIPPAAASPRDVALILYTSGTTAAPKGAVIRHENLTAYILNVVEFAAAGEEEAALVSVPTYHIAGIANLLSNVYAGRRLVYLNRFTPEAWLGAVRDERITGAMVVPTMLARIVEAVDGGADGSVPTLRSISYGGARMPERVIRRALELFPSVDFVNAYGLTETTSTVALLGPEEHRQALTSSDPVERARLGSVGKLIPTMSIMICDENGVAVADGGVGDIWLRGDQVSGEYLDIDQRTEDGWFATRDRGYVDRDGYLFIEGRMDDTIIRGGENIAPAEIEDVIARYPGVADVAVVGVPDEEWGERIAAVVVAAKHEVLDAADLTSWLKDELGGSRTPDDIIIRDSLPRNEMGKVLRQRLVTDLSRT
jgi:acyl-CoA synthetase (AMP-forming)/AMP-acid ligase II